MKINGIKKRERKMKKGEGMRNLKVLLALIGLVAVTVACTEELPYDKKTKAERLTKKSAIDTNAVHLYVPVVGDTLRTSSATRPHWIGVDKLVKFQFTETSLDLVELDDDSRFGDNPVNLKPVLSIPITHVDYKCTEDDYGDCQNKEEEDSDKRWNQKKYFVPDLEALNVEEVNFLPISLTNTFAGCYQELSKKPLSVEIGDDGLVIQIEKTLRAQGRCAGNIFDIDQLKSLTFKTRYTYNILKLDRMSSPTCDHKNVAASDLPANCYSVINYPHERDENTFGFFEREQKFLDVDNRDNQDDINYLLKRFNPKKGVVTYHLSDAFYKSENKSILEATKEGVKRINDSLKLADAGIQLELKSGKGLNTGDIRKNMIIMVEDPVAAGLLGYGPSIDNPATGEILHARTVMYLGTLKQIVKRAYENFRKEREAEAREIASGEKLDLTNGDTLTAFDVLTGKTHGGDSDIVIVDDGGSNAPGLGPVTGEGPIKQEMNKLHSHDIQRIFGHMSKEDLAEYYNVDPNSVPLDFDLSIQSRVQQLSEANAFPVEMMNAEGTIGKAIKDVFGDEELIAWGDLSKAQKQAVLDKMLPYMWISVLIHEMGHNLGLRHNFEGSQDKDNFYTETELKEMGINYEIPYSSVMDYAYSELNELPVMGKYDIAALKFGYARKVALKEGGAFKLTKLVEGETGKKHVQELTLVDVPQDFPLKSYGFCTDDHVGANAGCNRFDEGTTLTEIAEFMVKRYERFYETRNHRDGRRNFSLISEINYAARMDRTLFEMRRFYEGRERLKALLMELYGLPNDVADEILRNPPDGLDPGTKAFFKDVDNSAVVAGRFFMDVMKTPDVMCLLVNQAAPTQVLGVLPIKRLDPNAIECAGLTLRVNEQLTALAVAQTGKFFQSRKAPGNPDPNVDQIDVRGVYIDKLLAADYLLSRDVGSILFDKYSTPLLSHPALKEDIIKTLGDILMDDVVSDVKFRFPSGMELPARMSYELGADSTHVIERPIFSIVSRALQLPRAETMFTRELMLILERGMSSIVDHQGSKLLQSFAVKEWLRDGEDEKEFEVVRFGTQKYYAAPENQIAIAAIRGVKVVRILDQLERKRIQEILKVKTDGGELSGEISDVDRSALELEAAVIEAYLGGKLKDPTFYERLLDQLLNANSL